MLKQILCTLAAGTFATLGPSALAAPAPRLIVAISVDQFSADLYAEYRPYYTAGLKRLSGGIVFPSGYQSHGATETCPGHSTILTGARPARTGIVANEWIDQSLARADKQVYCAEDPRVPGSSSKSYTASAQHLKVPTLGDRLKAASPQSVVVSVAGKDRAALMLGGHEVDELWFWDGLRYTTLAGRAGTPPPAVDVANATAAKAIASPVSAALPEPCRGHAHAVPVGSRTVGLAARRPAGDARAFRTALEFDRATTDLALDLLRARGLGTHATTDLLAIGLSATDYVGHVYGVEGAEMCAQVLSVDQNVGRILAALDGLKVPYLVVLTADHGGHDLPERIRRHAIPDAARVDPALNPETLGRRLAGEFGLAGPALMAVAPAGDIYLARSVPEALRPRVLEAARAAYAAHPQVAAVYTAAELHRLLAPVNPVDEWTLAERLRASFDPERSGDLLVVLKPHVTPIADPSVYVATHGSPWNYDRRVPILFYYPGVEGYEQPLPVETVDIAPTLASWIPLALPADEIDGRCLEIAPEGSPTCPGSLPGAH